MVPWLLLALLGAWLSYVAAERFDRQFNMWVGGPKDPVALRAWYKKHLGIDVQEWGGTAFTWTDAEGNPAKGMTIWSVSPADGTHFAPSKSPFMVNYRVEDLAALLKALREEGCDVLDKTDDSEFGKFGWVMDPEGNKVGLWQPPPGQ